MNATTRHLIPHDDAIQVVKTLRDCPLNEELIKKEANRGYIYDYFIYVAGELRAQFNWNTYHPTWRLAYPPKSGSWKIIDYPHRQITAGTFKWHVKQALEKGIIPTLDEIKAKMKAEDRAKRAEKTRQRIESRKHQVRKAGPVLLDALKKSHAILLRLQAYRLDQADRDSLLAVLNLGTAAIREATKEVD